MHYLHRPKSLHTHINTHVYTYTYAHSRSIQPQLHPKVALPQIPLRGGDDKALMRFEIGAKAKVPDDADSVLFFELRYKVN